MVDINQNFFYKLLQQNHLAQNVNVEQINTLLKEYPAFHSLYILKALALKNISEYTFEQTLPQIATNVLDRTQLYDILFNPIETPISELEPTKIKSNSLKTEFSVEEAIKEDDKPQNQEISNSLNENQVEESNSQAIPKKCDDDIPTEGVSEKINEVQVKVSEKNEDVNESKTEIKEKSLIHKIEKDKQEILSFVEWLKQKNKNASSGESSKNDTKKVLTSTNLENQKVPFEAVSEIEAELMKSSARQPQSHLDSFINSQIAKKKNKKKFSAQKVENESNSQGLISETLAEILFLQKKYDDAIDVYEKLSLKYPQKSSYFASRIQKIKKII